MKTNKSVKIIIIILAVLIGLGIAKDQIIKAVVQTGASQVLGTNVRIGGLSFGILRPSVRIRALKIDNPKGFPQGSMLDVTQVGVDYDLPALLAGKLRFPLVILDLNEMVVIKNQDGVLNVDALKVLEKKEAAPDFCPPVSPGHCWAKIAPGRNSAFLSTGPTKRPWTSCGKTGRSPAQAGPAAWSKPTSAAIT